jgi:CRP-like cAMP-binding protein
VPETIAGSRSRVREEDLSGLIERALPRARPETRQFLVRAARVRTVRREEVIFHQGEPIPLTLVRNGYSAFRRTTADARQLILGLATRGDLFGFSSIAAQSASADLLAVTDGEVALWTGRDVRSLAAGDVGFALDAIEGMAQFTADIAERLDGFTHQDARQRVVRVLAAYEDLFFGPSAVLSRAYLPRLVGTSREMTGRVIRDLEREEVIARVGRTGLQLLAPGRLREAAGRVALEAS